MIIVAGGCSFIHGDELKDWDKVSGSQSTWPALLSSGHQYELVAGGGWSNQSIARNVINKVSQVGDCGVVVQWTFPARYEFRFAYDTGQRESPWYSLNPFTPPEHTSPEHIANAESRGITDFANSYVKNIAISEYWEIYNSLCEIVMLQNYLAKHNINYAFMTVDHTIFKPDIDTDISLKTLYSDINMSKFIDQEGMFTWAKRTEQQFYTTHPQESAHIEWINMLYDRIV